MFPSGLGFGQRPVGIPQKAVGHAGILALDAPLAQQCLPLCPGKNLPGPMDPAGAQAQGVGRKHQIAHAKLPSSSQVARLWSANTTTTVGAP